MNHLQLAELTSFPEVLPTEIPPTSVTIDITHACPFRCPGCIEGIAMRHSKHSSILVGTARRLISRFAEEYGVREVLLYGGEPTIHPHFGAIVRHAARCVPIVRVVTNGAFLEKPCVAKALKAAAEEAEVSVRVSLNAGTQATHEELHKVKGFFPRVVRGMKALKGSNVNLSVSYLLEEANANEVLQAYLISTEVGATDFWLRPKTGVHGIGLIPLSQATRGVVLNVIERLTQQTDAPVFRVDSWFLRYLQSGCPPRTTKPYPMCYYCGASRLVITPPEPGVVWSCPYWRADKRFLVADLSEVPFGSPEFERCRIAAIQRIFPPSHCARVICNRNEANKAIWERLLREKVARDWSQAA